MNILSARSNLSIVSGFHLVALTFLLAACAAKTAAPQSSFGFNGVQYHTADEALAAAHAFGDQQLAAVTPVQDRIGGKALIIVPDEDRLRPYKMQQTNAAKNPYVSVDYFIKSEQRAIGTAAESLKKSSLFDQADIVEQNEVEDPAFAGYDWLVWFKVATTGPNHTGQWYGRWQIRSASNAAVEPVTFDAGVAPTQRMVSFVASARTAAARLTGGISTASLSPSQLSSAGAKGALSGLVVGTHGDIVTNEHGFNGCTGVRVRSGSETLAASIVGRDHQNDLVLLHVDHNFSTVASFREAGPIRQGDPVIAVGFPLAQTLSSNPTVTTGTVSALSGMHDDTRFLQISAPVQPGNSGGPLVDSSGHVVGLVTSKLSALLVAVATGDIPQNVNFALKSTVIRDFLDTNGVKYRTAASGAEGRNADAADQAKSFTVFIECLK